MSRSSDAGESKPSEEEQGELGFVCQCGGEVEEVWEKITVRGGAGRYRCKECDRAGNWLCDLEDPEQSGLSGCLVRRDELEVDHVKQ